MARFPLDSLLFLSLQVPVSLSVFSSHPLPIIAEPHAAVPETKRAELIKLNFAAPYKEAGSFCSVRLQ